MRGNDGYVKDMKDGWRLITALLMVVVLNDVEDRKESWWCLQWM